ncbi:MAG: sigma-70 family RNA polymerase sigma factor [Puniceicoccales bacterium]|jgi:RNA polymerase sigma-70 factor (ECF subfamily)|nr:sigma-70 family RNA polymerase sigma factor [Puniceicoccales bacterium]
MVLDAAAESAECESAENGGLDLTLIGEVLNGEISAFNVIVHRYRKRIYGVIYHIIHSHADAADLTQDTFIQAFRSLHSYRGRSAFYTWLYRIAINCTLKQMRRCKSKRSQILHFDPMDQNALDDCSGNLINSMASSLKTDREIILHELRHDIAAALAKLSLAHRTAIVLSEMEGLSAEEIGEIVGCSAGTVRSRIHYAKEELKVFLGRYLKEI